ncbi:MAG: hypothetical protein ACRDZP_09900 [Acidimicrobiales bacterium]
MAVIEVTTFRLRPRSDEAAFLEADSLAQAEMSRTAGMLRRTTARAAGGEWLVVTLWRSEADADAAGDARTAVQGQDAATVETKRYHSLS